MPKVDTEVLYQLSENAKYYSRGSSSVGRALASQAGGRGFEPRLPLK